MHDSLRRGSVIRLPVGSSVWEGAIVDTKPTRIRKERYGVVEFGSVDGDKVFFNDRSNKHPGALVEETELITTDDHTLHVHKFNRGGHPIAGWNWPLWGYKWSCACGEYMGEDSAKDARESHEDHLRRLEASDV